MDEKSSLLANLFDKKTVEVLKKLLAKKDIFYLRDLSRETGVPLATTFRIAQKLVGLGLVGREPQGKFTWYKLNRDATIFKDVSDLVFGSTPDPMAQFKSVLQEKFGAFFHAYVTKDKDRKVFIVTDVLKPADVDEVAGKLSESAGGAARPNYMVVTQQFFEQMQAMGLVNKEKLSSL